MAYNYPSTFFLIALTLFATANPLANAQIIPITQGVIVTGRLCCTPTGNCARGSPGIPRQVVYLNCTRLSVVSPSVVVGRNITDANGQFNITVRVVPGFFSNGTIIPCFITVPLPISPSVCPALGTTPGTLIGILGPGGVVLTQMGLFLRGVVLFFFRV